MGKKAQSQLAPAILTLFIAGFFLIMGVIIISSMGDTIPNIETTTSDLILSDSSVANTLTQTPSTWSSATVKNQTWLEFDGVDDEVIILDKSIFSPTNNLEFSLSGWIYFNSTVAPDGSTQRPISKGDTAEYEWEIRKADGSDGFAFMIFK
ncbi:MAG TPA: hypothetical protein VMV86_04860, partial [Methanosarcinales archaeon]|nr:hypothetical protein [Methanosarcinales archaeon]